MKINKTSARANLLRRLLWLAVNEPDIIEVGLLPLSEPIVAGSFPPAGANRREPLFLQLALLKQLRVLNPAIRVFRSDDSCMDARHGEREAERDANRFIGPWL
jgi:hypothetical protein